MKHIFIALLGLISLTVAAQEDEPMDFDYIEVEFDSTVYRKDINQKPERKLQTGVDVTMGYMFSSAGYGGSQFALSPHVAYPLSDRFSLSAGMSVGYGNFYNPYYGLPGQEAMLPMTRMFLYVSGHYHVSEKLTVSGSAYTQLNDVPNPNPDSEKQDYNVNGASVGFQYRITPSLSVGAEMHFNDNGMYGPYSPVMNPYGRTSTGWW